MSYLLDTNIVSELRKPTCDPGVRAWFDSVHGVDKFLSVLVFGEIRRGINKLASRNEAQAIRLADWFSELKSNFATRIVPVTAEAALIWGRMASEPGRHLPPIDGLQAATAYLNDWTFVTRNTKDIEQTGALILNPFDS